MMVKSVMTTTLLLSFDNCGVGRSGLHVSEQPNLSAMKPIPKRHFFQSIQIP